MNYLVRGSSASKITATLTREDTGAPVVLDSASVVLRVRKRGTKLVLVQVPGLVLDPDEGTVVFIFKDALNTLTEGYFEGEIQVTHKDKSKEIVYELLSFQVRDNF